MLGGFIFPVWKECPTLADPAHCFHTKLKMPAVLQYCISDPRCCLTAPDSVSGVIYHCKGSRRIVVFVSTLRLYYYMAEMRPMLQKVDCSLFYLLLFAYCGIVDI